MSQTPDTFGCINNTIKVAAGHYVDLAKPDPATIDIQSIAAALSKICRYGGHCPRFYSVAEHCIHATNLAVADGCSLREQQAVFMHDAAEAYIGDMVKPLKFLLPGYSTIEDRVEFAIENALGVNFVRCHDTIKRYDRAMLKAEKTAMWPDDRELWQGFASTELRHVELQYWGPREAEINYLAMARSLQLCSPSTRVLSTSRA